jgi:hypothetical protein
LALELIPITFAEANEWVRSLHRHHKPVVGAKFCIGAGTAGELVGVAIIGRPVARMLDDKWTVEVTRCCTNGYRNACSFLYGAAWRAAQCLGYRRMVTYTLASESGASMRATGWRCDGAAGGGSWSRPSRLREDAHPLESKIRWMITAKNYAKVDRFTSTNTPKLSATQIAEEPQLQLW